MIFRQPIYSCQNVQEETSFQKKIYKNNFAQHEIQQVPGLANTERTADIYAPY